MLVDEQEKLIQHINTDLQDEPNPAKDTGTRVLRNRLKDVGFRE
jgi:hypothetical protein